ncbi:pyridoxamine 5'-phosphate oxidase-domain-containing protein [Armillaria novae-zelandiae]|uniref:Pyridoxamine 5'-phosphate oxidase-domain-containing protein n=1 Tax=Armillaria novae-zelandiae TaxID=153914 RepID=A0AA39PK51_9AGAR|nr:pyridoxamine 5'-phosphate oxidase-domain-containing protein [Armillaria novae-zelandiae]
MRLSLLLLCTTGALATFHESVEDAARIARSLVDVSPLSVGTMATVFPPDDPLLPGYPFSLQEYYARGVLTNNTKNSCLSNGSLTLLFLPISRHSRNILASPSHLVSISITSELPAAHKPRVSLLGNVTIFTDIEGVDNLKEIKKCYLEKHPDAKRWLPGDDDGAHLSYWARFDPESVYFVGGFGGRHYIGFIPMELYQNAGGSTDSYLSEHVFQKQES